MEKLTGELFYIILVSDSADIMPPWSAIDELTQQQFNLKAQALREKLNLCNECGLQQPPLLDGRCMACVAQATYPKADAFKAAYDSIVNRVEEQS